MDVLWKQEQQKSKLQEQQDKMEKRILIGLHYKDMAESKATMARHLGYEPVIAEDLDELMAEARTQRYERVHMDLNFGFPNSTNILPAVQVYEIFKSRIDQGLTKFLATSGNDETVRLAKEKGIPVVLKGNIDFEGFLN